MSRKDRTWLHKLTCKLASNLSMWVQLIGHTTLFLHADNTMDDPMLSHRFHHASWWTMNVVNPKYPNRGLVSGPWCQRKNEDKCKPLQPLKQQPQTITQPLGKYMPATLHKFCFFAPCHFWTTSCDQQRIGVHQFIPICLNHVECRIHICHV